MAMRIILAIGLLASSLAAQTSARPAFEVASVKPAGPIVRGQFKMGMTQDPGRVTIEGLPLSAIIARAYRVKAYQINGPDWIGARFDITAKLPAGASDDQIPEMLQTLLEDRFQMKFHREPKEMPVYALVVGKGGLKMIPVPETEGDPAPAARMVRFQPGHLTVEKMQLTALADLLSSFVDRPVVDQTETKGQFKITLDFALDMSMMGQQKGAGAKMMIMRDGGGGPVAGEAPLPDPAAPSIFTAVQEQLGLKLDPRKVPVDIMVIDHLEKLPTEN
jgi:uncharacterized protein (TIGR03435 family)